MLMDNTADILLDNIMRVMSGEYFGQTKAAAIVGGKKKLERLIESGKIEAVKPRNSQNGKWFCNAAQVLMHCRNMRKTGKTGKKKVKNFSLGMKQRLGIAMALLKNPEMIILDEPMNGLDPSGIVSIRKLLENLCVKNKITIVISSHILSELELLADVFYLIQNGKIIDKKRREELIDGKVNLEKYYMEKMGEE